MNTSTYQQESRQTWAGSFYGHLPCLPWHRIDLKKAAEFLDNQIDDLKKSLFYGDEDREHLQSGGDKMDTFEDLDLSSGEKDVLHAVLGIATEAGELLHAIEPLLYTQKERELRDVPEALDTVNLDEEMGDVYYYLARLHDALQSTPEDTMQRNLSKLLERYDGGSFNEEDALHRDLEKERDVLE